MQKGLSTRMLVFFNNCSNIFLMINKYLNKFKHLYIFLTLDNEKINRFTHSKLDKLKLFII